MLDNSGTFALGNWSGRRENDNKKSQQARYNNSGKEQGLDLTCNFAEQMQKEKQTNKHRRKSRPLYGRRYQELDTIFNFKGQREI